MTFINTKDDICREGPLYHRSPPTPVKRPSRLARQLPINTPNNTTETELMGINTAATKGDKAPLSA